MALALFHMLCGGAFLALAVAASRELIRRSALVLGRQLPWLIAFAVIESVLQGLSLLQMLSASPEWLEWLRLGLLPLSGLMLIRFGVGLLSHGGPLPGWLLLAPFIVLVPLGLLATYILVLFVTEPAEGLASLTWTRYLLLVPGGALVTWGLFHQARLDWIAASAKTRRFTRTAAVAFLAYTVVFAVPVPQDAARYWGADLDWVGGDGVTIWLRITQTVVAVALTYVVTRALDVFELEHARALQAVDARLRESQQRLGSIVEHSPIGIHVADDRLRLVHLNDAFAQMLGHEAHELEGRELRELIHPDDRAPVLRILGDVRSGRSGRIRTERRYLTKDGGTVEARLTIAAFNDERDELEYVLAMVEDVTEQNRFERKLEEERARVQEHRIRTLAEARRTTEDWVKTLASISRRIAQLDSLDEVLAHILAEARRLLGADVVTVGLFDEEGRLGTRFRANEDGFESFDGPGVDPHLAALLLDGRRVKFPGDDDSAGIAWHCPDEDRRVRAAGLQPLKIDGLVVGGMWVCYFDQPRLFRGQMQGLGHMSTQVILALQQARVVDQLRSAATVEERSRIAREMHDGLAQILGYLSLQIQTIESFVHQGEYARVLTELQRTRSNVKAAHADVRDNILSLRTTLSGNLGFVSALEDYLRGFGTQHGLSTSLEDRTDGEVPLSPLVEVQLTRVIQEALTNVRKHADASSVDVHLWVEDEYLRVDLRDDGTGFAVGGAGDGSSFGLATMRERMEDVGGAMDIHSAPGRGTRVQLCLPLLKSGESHGQVAAALGAHRR